MPGGDCKLSSVGGGGDVNMGATNTATSRANGAVRRVPSNAQANFKIALSRDDIQH